MKKNCIKCGASFEARKPYLDKTLCDKCAQESRKNNVIRERVCVDCGEVFPGYPRSLRCPSCNETRKKELRREQRKRQNAGKTRKIGSISHCLKCGGEYVVNSGLQKYCPECSAEAIRENDRAKSREWSRENTDYSRKRSDREKAVSEIPCIVCGKMFKPHTKSLTCSVECAKELIKINRKKRIEAMTDEEKAEYQEKQRETWRRNYWRRKEKQENENKGEIQER